MAEKLKSNNIEFVPAPVEPKASSGPSQPQINSGVKPALIDQYKAKLAKAQKELDQKIREM